MSSMKSWFKALFGVDEGPYREVQKNFSVSGTQLHCGSRKWEMGTFTTPSVKELREEALKHAKEAADKLAGQQWRVEHIATSDIMKLHGQPENSHAVFQAASQFNCLEFVSPAVVPEQGIACYAGDPTQGPSCAMACAPGTLYRNYFTTLAQSVGQQRDKQINNLADLEALAATVQQQQQQKAGAAAAGGAEKEDSATATPPRFWRVKNGYTEASAEGLARFNALLEQKALDRRAAIDAVRIGIQADTEVVFSGRRGGEPELLPSAGSSQPHLVTQAYVSAISVGYSMLPASKWEPLARIVLDASYEATLWQGVLAAAKHGVNTVFLTFVGGGVFRNEMPWITDSINRAVSVVRAECPAVPLHVKVVHFRAVNQAIADAVPSV
eukprot:m.59350 g.59350  ORF g.59350 m.59350 type:complete len:383 (-) comp13571_c0_seq1:217-1365(-)